MNIHVTSSSGWRVPVRFGPARDTLPPLFTADVKFDDRPIRLLIDASFDGSSRVQATAVTVRRTDAASVTPEDMADTRLGWVMNRVVRAAMYPAPGPADLRLPEQSGPLSMDELAALARLYWIEHAAWGEPRQAIMRAFHIPRSTANYWIRKAREHHELPATLQ